MNKPINEPFEPAPAPPAIEVASLPFAVFHFMLLWTVSRCWRRLTCGVLAVATAAAVVWLIAYETRRSEYVADLTARYEGAAVEALSDRHWEHAHLLYRKLAFLDGEQPSTRFGLAVTLANRGETGRALWLMNSIAPPDRSGYGPAHCWLAEHLLARADDGGITAHESAALKHHLLEAHRFSPEEPSVCLALSHLFQREGDYRAALAYHAVAARREPGHLLAVARLQAVCGDQRQARASAESAIRHFAARLRTEPGDVATRVRLAHCHMFLEDFALAESVLLAAPDHKAQDQIRQALGLLFRTAADSALHGPVADLPRARALLVQALQHAPDDPDVLIRLARLADRGVPLPPAALQSVRAWLEHALESVDDPAAEDLILLAKVCSACGDVPTAVRRLEAVPETYHGARLLLARLLQLENDHERAVREAEAVQRRLHKQIDAGSDARPLLAWLAEAETLLGRWERAEQRLSEAHGDHSPELAAALAALHLRRAESLSDADGEERLELLLRAVTLAPQSGPALLAVMAAARRDAAAHDRIVTAFQELLASGRVPHVAHAVLGSIAADDEQWAAARFHLELAHRGLPDDPAVRSRLAWALLHHEDPPIERALELIEAALRDQPGDREALIARGLVRVQRRDWTDAIADLESALEWTPAVRRVHRLLAEAYDGAGNAAMAEHHRRRSEAALSQTE